MSHVALPGDEAVRNTGFVTLAYSEVGIIDPPTSHSVYGINESYSAMLNLIVAKS